MVRGGGQGTPGVCLVNPRIVNPVLLEHVED
jgi:hypothetical protein